MSAIVRRKIYGIGLGFILATLSLAAVALAEIADEFLPVVGVWRAENDEGKQVLKEDGRRWKRGQASPELRKSAALAFGDKAAGFEKSVSSAASFPFAIYAGVGEFDEGILSVRFKPLAGKSDQAGGILFDLRDNGDYLVLRANALEDNLILFRYKDGRRSALKEAGNAPVPAGSWSELKTVIKGKNVQGYLNDKLLLEYVLDHPVSGKVGLWSKDDSVVLFEEFSVAPVEK